MGVVLALDVGGKRTGMAVSDESHTFSFPLQTVETHKLADEIRKLLLERPITELVMGMPKNLKNEDTDGTKIAERVKNQLTKTFPALPISLVDERFTSRMAQQAMIQGGMKKSDRQQKENTDKLSATLILQSFLEQKARFGNGTGSNSKPDGI